MAITFPSSSLQFGVTGHIPRYAVAKLDSTHYVIVYNDSFNGNCSAVVASISGTTITYGTPVQFSASSTSDYMSVVGLDATHFVIHWRDSGIGAPSVICGVTSGTTITSFGSEVNVCSGSSYSKTGGNQSICVLDSTHFVLSYFDGSVVLAKTVCCSVSGTTITLGTAVTTDASISSGTITMPITAIDSTHFGISYILGSSGYLILGSVSGTTITLGTKSSAFTTNLYQGLSSFAIDTTHVGICFGVNATPDFYSIVAVISGTTFSSWGTAVSIANSSSNGVGCSSVQIDSTHFVVSFNDYTATKASSILGTISGTSITFDSSVNFDNQYYVTSGGSGYSSTALLDSTHFVVAWEGVTSTISQSIIGLISAPAATTNASFLLNFM